MVNEHPINFFIFYESDEQEAEHAEALKNKEYRTKREV